MNEQPILQLKSITKSFAGVHALKGISLDLYKGEVHALVGENGAGKSTLMNILSGIYQPDDGKIILNDEEIKVEDPRDGQDRGIAMIHQELALSDTTSVMENIFVGRLKSRYGIVNFKAMYEESKKVLHELEVDYIDPSTIVKELSTSEKQLVEIAKALVLNSNILIMDEPTSSLTMHETKVLLNIIDRMRRRGVSIVYISHRLEEVTEIADKVTVMRDGELIRTCNIEETSIDKIVTDMVGRKLIRAYKRESTTSKFENKVVLEVNNLSNHKLKNISFSLQKGEILGITGLVGAGRTELLQSLFGLEKNTTGDIIINEAPRTINSSAEAIKLKMGLVPEGRKTQGVFLNLSVKENMAIVNRKNYVRGVFISDKIENIELNKQKDLLSIKTPNLAIPISSLSGGNQQKVVLSRWLLSEPDILLLDEPTHGIDVGAKSEIYEIIDALSKKGVSIILVSSELPEVLMLADRIIVMSNGKITGTVDKAEATQELIMNYAIEV